MEQLASFHALRAAALRAARGHRRRREVAAFLADLERHVLALQRELLSGAWVPGEPRVFRIRDPKPRVISAAPFRDRVVHHALMAALEPRFEALADPDSFACRPGGGPWAAVARLRVLARDLPWAGRLDVRHFFESVEHDVVMEAARPALPEGPVAALWEQIVRAGGADGRGLPIGSLVSQHAANRVLGVLDADRRRAGVRGYAQADGLALGV
ncbi:MAG TPA: RNA-dependent DNA polymerase, partial [Myxococcota bacterium]|nr:RNA-dependent DNA polymerase [Myxococcota bacterium]